MPVCHLRSYRNLLAESAVCLTGLPQPEPHALTFVESVGVAVFSFQSEKKNGKHRKIAQKQHVFSHMAWAEEP